MIELADRGLEVDRLDKLSSFARDGIPEYSIVNLVDRQLEVYEQPTGAAPNPTYCRCNGFAGADGV